MRQKLSDALNGIRDSFITEAAQAKAKKKPYWLGTVAAVLAVVLLFQIGSLPMTIQAQAVSQVPECRLEERPDRDDYETWEEWRTVLDGWDARRNARKTAMEQAALSLTPFFQEGSHLILSDDRNKNQIWSPINAYIGLAMAAELSSGASRQQILDLFDVSDVEALRSQVSTIWEEISQDDGNEICVLANSLWLEEGLIYNQDTMDNLSYHYYASVYEGDLGGKKINKAISAWLNNNTGGLLKDSADSINLSDETILALYSTIYFQSKWSDQFSASKNTHEPFHSPSGDITCTFMNKDLLQTDYYWGEDFGAVSLWLKNDSRMWFFLPDEDKTPADVLASSQYLQLITDPYVYGETNGKYMKVNLSVPKFDITSNTNIRSGLEAMGITDVFDPGAANFSATLSGMPVWLTAANQATRVIIDEEGVKAAAYIEFPGAGAAQPPEEIIDFILDRPFVFVISKENLPLFTGVVNQP